MHLCRVLQYLSVLSVACMLFGEASAVAKSKAEGQHVERGCDYPQSYFLQSSLGKDVKDSKNFTGNLQVSVPPPGQAEKTVCVLLVFENESDDMLSCQGSVLIQATKKGTSTQTEKKFVVSFPRVEVSSRTAFETPAVKVGDFGEGYQPTGVNYHLVCSPTEG